jgi:glycosyltransferase involved in cell wall biosynthesis
MRLRIAAKARHEPERAYLEEHVRPALGEQGEFLGEVGPDVRDPLLAGARATLRLGAWPEPFGLVAIESLACGTPVLARRVGALDEIIRDGEDGFFGDDVTELAFLVDRVAELDRPAIRASVIERFSATRMADGYEALYARILGLDEDGPSRAGIVEMRRDAAAAAR